MPAAKSKSTAIPELAVNPFAFEVFQLASKQRSKAKKVEVLKKYEHASIKALFIWNLMRESLYLLSRQVKFPMPVLENKILSVETSVRKSMMLLE